MIVSAVCKGIVTRCRNQIWQENLFITIQKKEIKHVSKIKPNRYNTEHAALVHAPRGRHRSAHAIQETEQTVTGQNRTHKYTVGVIGPRAIFEQARNRWKLTRIRWTKYQWVEKRMNEITHLREGVKMWHRSPVTWNPGMTLSSLANKHD